MVQVVENRAEVEAKVVALRRDALRPAHHLATLEIRLVSPVEGYPNLFTGAEGKSLDVLMPAAVAATVAVGGAFRCRIRRAGLTTVFAEQCSPIDR